MWTAVSVRYALDNLNQMQMSTDENQKIHASKSDEDQVPGTSIVTQLDEEEGSQASEDPLKLARVFKQSLVHLNTIQVHKKKRS